VELLSLPLDGLDPFDDVYQSAVQQVLRFPACEDPHIPLLLLQLPLLDGSIRVLVVTLHGVLFDLR